MEATIAAIATSVGEGGIGIIRISGERALAILEEIFTPVRRHREKGFAAEGLLLPESVGETVNAPIVNRRLTYGFVSDENGSVIDEVLAVYMKAPYTYTMEDVVEINCHGSVVSLRKILALVLRKGARMAEAGEFTKRAFLNGRLDLTQAEAVMDLIKAKTDRSYDTAISQLEGGLSKEVKSLRQRIMDVLVEMTVNIDYPDEDIEEITYDKLVDGLSQIGDDLEKLRATGDTGKILREGFSIVIAGRPNVGKSSLMNMLLKESRAIVTEIAGTTRDTIEETVSIRGIPVKLTDTAGIRATEDTIERIGISRSLGALERADLVIFMVNAGEALCEEDLQIAEFIKGRKVLALLNKTDLGRVVTADSISELLPGVKSIETVVKDGVGISEIEQEIQDMVYGGQLSQGESVLVTNTRHIALLENAISAVSDALKAAKLGEALDIVEIDVRRAFDYLGEITGETASDDIINEVFARFCLGK